MLELLLVYYIGKPYYRLAEIHGKSKWGYAILGGVTYYAVLLLFALLLGTLMVVFDWEALYNLPDLVLGVICMPFGILAAWGLRLMLKKNWEQNTSSNSNNEILDGQDFLEVPED